MQGSHTFSHILPDDTHILKKVRKNKLPSHTLFHGEEWTPTGLLLIYKDTEVLHSAKKKTFIFCGSITHTRLLSIGCNILTDL